MTQSQPKLGIEYCDIKVPAEQSRTEQCDALRSTFFWKDASTWESRDFEVTCEG